MPRGFLVKRAKKAAQLLGGSKEGGPEEGAADVGPMSEEYDVPLQLCTQFYQCPYGSPDSGFSQSPVNLTTKDHRSHDTAGGQASPLSDSCNSEDSAKPPSVNNNNNNSYHHGPKEPLRLHMSDMGGAKCHFSTLPATFAKSRNLVATAEFTKNAAHPFGMATHLLPNPLSIATSGAHMAPFYFPNFESLNVTSPKDQVAMPRGMPFLPPPGIFPGFPATLAMPNRVAASAPRSPLLSPANKRKAPEPGSESSPKPKAAKKPKAARKIHFDEEKSSPVSGTIIRDASDMDEDSGYRVVSGDIDSSLNFVEVTPEAREEISKIENKIGAYVCQLCKDKFEDAFLLAQHSCPRIVHVEYRCPECDKVFSCPANLASHRRWHKPRGTAGNTNNNNNNNNSNNNNHSNSKDTTNSVHHNNNNNHHNPKSKAAGPLKVTEPKRALDSINGNITNGHLHPALFVDNKLARTEFMLNCGIENMMQHHTQSMVPTNSPSPDGQPDADGHFDCDVCGKKFRRQAYLRKHMATHSQAPTAPGTVAGELALPCPVCGKVFRSESSHSKHLAQEHGTTAQAALAGMPRLEPINSRAEFACALCGQNMASKLDLEHHQRLQHANEVYSCKYCTAVFYSSPGLTRHINKCHPSENRQVILLHMPHLPAPSINSPC